MKIYHLLQTDSPYKKDDIVTGTVYEVNRDLGAFVAVDNLYSALIPKREMYGRMCIRDRRLKHVWQQSKRMENWI